MDAALTPPTTGDNMATKQTANNNAGLYVLKFQLDEWSYRAIAKALNNNQRAEAIRIVAEEYGRPSRGGLNGVARIVGLLAKKPSEACESMYHK